VTHHDRGTSSRRDLLSLGVASGAMKLLSTPGIAYASGRDNEAALSLNVRAFGTAGDAATDDTAAFQRALDAAYKSGGGAVYVPPGRYLFKGSITIPDGVGLRGSFGCVPSHNGIRDHGQPKPGDDGSAMFVAAGRGDEDGKPFLTLNTNSSVSGLTFYYPEQVPEEDPVPYPWTIAMRGKSPAAFDLELLNPYQGIDASQNERHNIRNISGQPLRRGIWVDAIYDIGRIENVHFNPWWNSHGKAYRWQTANGEAFIFGRADWEYVLNTFCFGYHVGYKFVETKTGSCNGNFLGIGADDCNRAILVEQCAPYGLLIGNGEFTSFHGDDPTMLDVRNTNSGVVRISNSAFWGPCNQIAKVGGQGTVGFSDCTFVQWGSTEDRAAIQATSGSLLVRGCEFRQKKRHIALGESVERAVITGNLFDGPAQIENASKMDVQIGLNAASH
jgi:Pectate lyase superfamily protein